MPDLGSGQQPWDYTLLYILENILIVFRAMFMAGHNRTKDGELLAVWFKVHYYLTFSVPTDLRSSSRKEPN